jgi:site-specific recombinase XerD
MLTSAQNNITYPSKLFGGGYMGGSSIYDKKSGHWFVQMRWNGQTERFYRYEYKGSWLSFGDKKTADKIKAIMQTEIDNDTFNPATYRPDSPLAIQQYVELWLSLADVVKNTLKRYRSYSRLFVAHFGETKDIRKISKVDILKLKKWLEEKEYSKKTVKHVIATLKTMLFFALDNKDINSLPSFPELPNIIKTSIDYLKKDVQDMVFNEIPKRHRAIFEFMAEYGLRIQEGRAFMKDAETDTHIIIMRRLSEYELLEGDKVGRVRAYLKTKRATEILKSAAPSFSQFYFTHNGYSPYDNKMLNKIFREACETVGVKIKLNNAIRHSKAGHLLDAGFPMEVVSAILGHSKLQMTRDMYGRVSEVRIREALEAVGEVVQLPATNKIPTKN